MPGGSDDEASELLVCSICLQRLGAKGGPASLPCGHNGCIDCLKEVHEFLLGSAVDAFVPLLSVLMRYEVVAASPPRVPFVCLAVVDLERMNSSRLPLCSFVTSSFLFLSLLPTESPGRQS